MPRASMTTRTQERIVSSSKLDWVIVRPWQNCFAERLIGTIRRERVDHVVAFSEEHLRQVLKSYASYYNTARTHRSLAKDAPLTRPIQRIGRIVSHALIGGLHHQYARISGPATAGAGDVLACADLVTRRDRKLRTIRPS